MITIPKTLVTAGAVFLMTLGIAMGDETMTKQLMDSARRQDAWTNIVSNTPKDTFVDGEEWWQELLTARVTHVLVCPQPQGDPMYAVFLDEEIGQPQGHYELMLPDGTLVGQPCDGNNMVEPTDMMADINGDGIVEFVSTLNGLSVVSEGKTNTVDLLLVTPILPVQKPNFAALFNPRPKQQSLLSALMPGNYTEFQRWINGQSKTPVRAKRIGKDYWFWKLVRSSTGQAEIHIGPWERDRLAAKAAFRWSPQQTGFVGPSGSSKEGFMFFTGGDWHSHLQTFSDGLK